MTLREIEVWIEGRSADRHWQLRALAWTQANIINAQIPRGKPRLSVEKLLPKKPSAQESVPEPLPDLDAFDESITPEERARRARERVRAKRAAEASREFWTSAEGRRILMLLGEQDEESR